MQPLAERMRPNSLDNYIGQSHLVGKGAVLRQAIETGKIPSYFGDRQALEKLPLLRLLLIN